jgi:hypothetical protein
MTNRFTPHKHADMLKKYAEVAAYRNDPWVEFQILSKDGIWINFNNNIAFVEAFDYRWIGDWR